MYDEDERDKVQKTITINLLIKPVTVDLILNSTGLVKFKIRSPARKSLVNQNIPAQAQAHAHVFQLATMVDVRKSKSR